MGDDALDEEERSDAIAHSLADDLPWTQRHCELLAELLGLYEGIWNKKSNLYKTKKIKEPIWWQEIGEYLSKFVIIFSFCLQ